MLAIFFNSVKDEVVELEKAIKVKNYEEIYSIAHSIKGSSGNLRLKAVFEKAKEIEQHSKNKNISINYTLLLDELNGFIQNYAKDLT